MPGVLPVLNKKAVEFAIRAALSIHCHLPRVSRFDRKNYFYPDLPKGYQISQYEFPLAVTGYLDIEVGGNPKRIGVTRIHMEEDAGKSSHDEIRPLSRVDLNRAGIPLIEIVSEPDIRSPEEAGAYLRKLHAILRYIDVCDGNMEEGSFRCDANVSVRPKGEEAFGTRTELKNLNSFKNVEKAIQIEIDRQIGIVEDGGRIIQETRLYNADKNRTTSMRGKEDAHDYRYFPEPDLLPLVIEAEWIDSVRKTLPELPDQKKQRFMEAYQVPQTDAEVLTSSRELADFFEACLKNDSDAKITRNWVLGPFLAFLNAQGKSIGDSPVAPENLAALVTLIKNEVISDKMAKTVFDEMAATGKRPEAIVEEKGLVQVTDTSELEQAVRKVIAANPKEAADFKGGKTKLMSFFVGQVMRETKGKANPKIVNQLLSDQLNQE
jgi:aspartyl-tRNA(Asn)/glutamyl-tRNA(Gln) amidotransferase subunit B